MEVAETVSKNVAPRLAAMNLKTAYLHSDAAENTKLPRHTEKKFPEILIISSLR
jgi:hypothetical protein